MEEIVLYSTGCPKCRVLEAKLDQKGVKYAVKDSVEEMESLGIQTVPVLSVDGELKNFSEAIRWLNQ